MSMWSKVKEFHKAFGLPVADTDEYTLPGGINCGESRQKIVKAMAAATALGESTKEGSELSPRVLRVALLAEEFAEYLDAELRDDKAGIADALADMHYIAAGTEAAYGINGKAVFSEVHRSNMAKLGEYGAPIYNEAGKVVKPKGWTPPDIEKAMKK